MQTLQLRILMVGLFVFCIQAVQSGDVKAGEKSNMEAAKRSFMAGQQFMKMERYADAIVEFRKAYAITNDGLVFGQVALAFEKAGDYESALESIKKYQEALPEGDRPSVDPLVSKYEQLIQGGRSKRLVLPGEKQTPDSKMGAISALPDDRSVKDADPLVESGNKRKGRLWTWVAAGTAGVLAVSSLVVGLSAKSRYDELKDRCGPETGGTCAQSDVDSVDTRAVVTDVLWGTALAAGIVATVLYFVEGNGETDRSTVEEDLEQQVEDELESEEMDDGLVRNFRISPLVSQGTFGFGAAFNY